MSKIVSIYQKLFLFIKNYIESMQESGQRYQDVNKNLSPTVTVDLADDFDFVRKNIISMANSRPMSPYIKLSTLEEKLHQRGKGRKNIRMAHNVFVTNMKKLEDFEGFQFPRENAAGS